MAKGKYLSNGQYYGFNVTSVNGQTGDVNVPTVAVSDTQPASNADIWIDTSEPSGESGTVVTKIGNAYGEVALGDKLQMVDNQLNVKNFGRVSCNNATTLAQVATLVRANNGKGGGNIGNLESTNLKTIITNPTGFANYTRVYIDEINNNLFRVTAIYIAGTKVAVKYFYDNYDSENYVQTAWTVYSA